METFVGYGQDYPARYRLLFSDPSIAARGGALEAAAMSSFVEFAAIIQECQEAKNPPAGSHVELAGLIYASVHGLIDLQAGGRLRKEKGVKGVLEGVELLVHILSQSRDALPKKLEQTIEILRSRLAQTS